MGGGYSCPPPFHFQKEMSSTPWLPHLGCTIFSFIVWINNLFWCIYYLSRNACWCLEIWECGRRCLAALNKFHKIQRNEIERIRGIVLAGSLTHVIVTHVLNPLVISYKKYIYWKYFMRFIRVWLTSYILVTPDFELTVKRYPVLWFSLTLNIKWYIRGSWRTRNSNRVHRQSLRQAPGFLDRGPLLVVPSCRGCLQKHPNHTTTTEAN